MASTKFTYNPATCRYEPAKISVVQILGYGFSLLMVSALLFAGLAYLQGRFFVTPGTLALRAENQALQKHYTLLRSQLVQLDGTLTQLKYSTELVEAKLFAIPNTTPSSVSPSVIPEGTKEAQHVVQGLQNKVAGSLNTAALNNYQYASSLTLTAHDKALMANWPSGQPIASEYLAVASGYGQRIHPFHKGIYFHQGLDFAAPQGTPIFATGPGKVIDIETSNLEVGYGNYVEVDHGNGIITRYAHLQGIAVKAGQAIVLGTVIGTVGMSGGAAAPHLHYEIIKDGDPVNPMLYMMQGLTSTEFTSLKSQSEKRNQSLD